MILRSLKVRNTSTNEYLTSLDLIDPIQGKVSGIAEQELSYKTYYDPATYTIATDTSVTIDQYSSWGIKNVGKLIVTEGHLSEVFGGI